MEYEHVVEEDDLGHTNSNGIVVIASSFAWNRASRSGSSAATHSPNKMMTDKDNDNHNIKECGGSSEMTTSFSYYSALRCDSHSDNHRLKNTPTPKGKGWSHNSYHPDERHRPNVIVGGRAGSSRNVSPASLKMVLLLSVVFLVRGVTSVSSSSLPDSNRIDDDEDRKVQNGHMWNNANDGGRGKFIQGLKTIEDIDLIKDDQQDDFNDPGNKDHYTHQWAVHILGGPEVARRVAEKHGFNFHGEIFEDYYHLIHARVAKRSIEPHAEYHDRLASEPEVRWLKQQTVRSRVKRDFLPEPMALSASSPSSGGGTSSGSGKSGRSRAARRSKSITLNDPRWPAMWYLNRGGGLDMNVLEAWNEGITGKGIVVTILDDGLEKDHPDIVRNYDPMASFDVNSLDMDPMPTYDLTDSNRHGTRCAGEVAAEANNSICAVGIAFEAGVGGVRMLDGDVTDAVEARSLSHNPQHIDIYSASWGPDDDGKTVDGPGELATRAFIEGVTKGRNGKGSIFVWASGNGGRDHDNCNCDGYTNSIWTLSISSATENGLVPWYSEACSSTLATTYSSGGTGEKQIVTIDLHHSCTSSHTGTSASAPLAAGICALALQANTNLTWRDMQHIVVRTARPQHLIATDWATNGVGRNVSHSFGYGLMDAGAMVKLSKKWKMVPPQHKCEIKAPYTDKNIPSKSKVTLDLKVTNCPNVNYLEHVQAKVSLTSGRRGDLQIFLVSPSGTRSQLLAHRRHDLNRAGFTDWPFMTVHSWGESPIGKWTLEIHNEGRYTGRTVLKRWSLVLYGTEQDINANYTGGGGGGGSSRDGKASLSSPTSFVASSNPQQAGSFIVYTPRNSSLLASKSEHVLVDGNTGSKGTTGATSPDLSGRKPARQRVKGKYISKKQKGATSATPTVKPPSSESHVIITSDDEEFRQFLQSKFGLVKLSSSLGGVAGGGGSGSIAHNRNFIQQQHNGTSAIVSAAHALVPIVKLSNNKEPKDETSSLIRASQEIPLFPEFTNSPSQSNKSSSTGFNQTSTFSTTTEPDSSSSSNSISSSEALTSNNKNVNAMDRGQDVVESRVNNVNASQEELSTSSSSSSSNNQTQIKQGKLQTWTLIAHGITLNPNDQGDDSGIGGGRSEGGSTKGTEGQQGTDASASGNTAAVVEFDGSDNTIVLESSSSQLHNSPPLAAHAGEAKPVSIVGRPESPASSSSATSGCAKMSGPGQCLECVPGLALLHAGCVSQCPATFYVESRGHPSLQPDTEDSSNSIHYVCLPCHYSCQSCSGPNDDECVTCHGDAKLHRESATTGDPAGTDKAHCYPAELLDALDSSGLWHRILLAGVALSILFILSMLTCLCCDCWSSSKGVDGKPGYEDGGHHPRQGWLTKGGQAQPYKMISREEIDDEDDEEIGYEYYDAYNKYKGSKPRSQSNQTHLELISEDEEEDGSDSFEKVGALEEHSLIQSQARAAPGMAEQINTTSIPKHSKVIPPKVPLVIHSHSGSSSSRNPISDNSPSSVHSYTESSHQSDQSHGPLA